MKTALEIMLVLVLCLASLAVAQPSITVDQTSFQRETNVTVSWSDITPTPNDTLVVVSPPDPVRKQGSLFLCASVFGAGRVLTGPMSVSSVLRHVVFHYCGFESFLSSESALVVWSASIRLPAFLVHCLWLFFLDSDEASD